MKPQNKLIGIFGGSFDPIHLGHLMLAKELMRKAGLDHVRFVPSREPVHRKAPLATANDRCHMLEIALQHENRFVIDRTELDRATPSYTIETLTTLKPTFPDTTLCLMLGMDTFLHFLEWHEPMRILELAHLIVATRPQHELPKNGAILELLEKHECKHPSLLHTQERGLIMLFDTTPVDWSSASIRCDLQNDRMPKEALPQGVLDYILDKHLYTQTTNI